MWLKGHERHAERPTIASQLERLTGIEAIAVVLGVVNRLVTLERGSRDHLAVLFPLLPSHAVQAVVKLPPADPVFATAEIDQQREQLLRPPAQTAGTDDIGNINRLRDLLLEAAGGDLQLPFALCAGPIVTFRHECRSRPAVRTGVSWAMRGSFSRKR